MRAVRLVAVWTAATALLTSVTWQVVGAAEDRVSDEPLSRLVAIPVPSTSTPPIPAGGPPTSEATPTTPSTEATPRIALPPTTAPDGAPPVATTTPAAWSAETLVTPGGVVLFSYRPGEVRLEAVTSTPGWSYEVTRETPTELEIRFTGRGHGSAVAHARWTDGGIETDVDD